jgi:hypothetical protein
MRRRQLIKEAMAAAGSLCLVYPQVNGAWYNEDDWGSGLIWSAFMNNPDRARAMQLAGFVVQS